MQSKYGILSAGLPGKSPPESSSWHLYHFVFLQRAPDMLAVRQFFTFSCLKQRLQGVPGSLVVRIQSLVGKTEISQTCKLVKKYIN